jgi:hypothetical protein
VRRALNSILRSPRPRKLQRLRRICAERESIDTRHQYWAERPNDLQDRLNDQLDTNHLSRRTSYGDESQGGYCSSDSSNNDGDGSQDEGCDSDPSSIDGDGSQDEDCDPESSGSDGDGSLTNTATTTPALAAAATPQLHCGQTRNTLPAPQRRAHTAKRVAKQKAAAAANAAIQREAAAAVKKHNGKKAQASKMLTSGALMNFPITSRGVYSSPYPTLQTLALPARSIQQSPVLSCHPSHHTFPASIAFGGLHLA